jgi:hypothetical protein
MVIIMGFGYIFAGFIFLFNPNINIIDVLPDFIGYALIIFGLYRLRDLAPAIGDSMRSFIRLIISSLIKTALMFIIPALPDKGFLLVFSFCFTLIEVAFLLSAFISLFDGLFFIGTLYDGGDMVKNLNNAKMMTILFVFIRGIFSLLPEFIYLYVTEDLGYILLAYKGVIDILCALIALVTGIVWLVFMHRFYKAIAGDKHFIDNITIYYKEYIKPNYNLFLRRYMKYALALFGTGLLFLPDIYIDGIDYLPDTIGLLLIMAGFFAIRKYCKNYRIPLSVCSVSVLLSAFGWIYVKIYADRYFVYGVGKTMEAYRMYVTTIIISAAEAAVLIILLIFMTRYLLSIIKEHTGREVESVFISIIAKDKHQKKMMRIQCFAFVIVGAVAALSGVAYTVCLYLLPAYWMINTAISIIWLAVSSKLMYDLRDQTEKKYM